MIFDLQDVGTRLYTYVSTMHRIMEACAENNIPLIVLDRPNPNIAIVDGPVLDIAFKSGIGMHPTPLLHGMTFGKHAKIINGKKCIKVQNTLKKVQNYGFNDVLKLFCKSLYNSLPQIKNNESLIKSVVDY